MDETEGTAEVPTISSTESQKELPAQEHARRAEDRDKLLGERADQLRQHLAAKARAEQVEDRMRRAELDAGIKQQQLLQEQQRLAEIKGKLARVSVSKPPPVSTIPKQPEIPRPKLPGLPLPVRPSSPSTPQKPPSFKFPGVNVTHPEGVIESS